MSMSPHLFHVMPAELFLKECDHRIMMMEHWNNLRMAGSQAAPHYLSPAYFAEFLFLGNATSRFRPPGKG